jgi:hypothetical protein
MHPDSGYRCVFDTDPSGDICVNIGSNQYDWCLRKNSLAKDKAKCEVGVCNPFVCNDQNSRICVSCSTSNLSSISDISQCSNGTLSIIGCAADDAGCYALGGIPGQGSTTTGTQDLDANSMFSSLINLLYYLMILVMIGFGVFIIAAGMHAAIGVVKR